jgi:hypothetical protein
VILLAPWVKLPNNHSDTPGGRQNYSGFCLWRIKKDWTNLATHNGC